ncbi:MAG TPA: carbohydrate ABC transporter permease [Roseiflexaceae bacterium]|nr:carbohydrate ABC transporter permease [Roseiflexaceae bacterium]
MNHPIAERVAAPAEPRTLRRPRTIVRRVLSHALLIAIAALFAVPFLWLVITSLKQKSQVFTDPLVWVPDPVMWSNYPQALTTPGFPYLRLLANTVLYAVASTLGMVVSSAVVAYAFARMTFRGREVLFGITLATMMLPGIVTLIPTYVLFRIFGWVGSYAPLIVPMWFGGAFNIFLLRQFMLTIPLDLTDAARVDGAGDFTILWRVMAPLVRPALIVVALFHFLYTWNDFMGPLIYLDEVTEAPLVLGLYTFRGRFGGSVEWQLMMAATMAVIAPIVALFFLAQRYFIEGVTLTGLKGA